MLQLIKYTDLFWYCCGFGKDRDELVVPSYIEVGLLVVTRLIEMVWHNNYEI